MRDLIDRHGYAPSPASPTGSVACSASNGSSTTKCFDARYLVTLDGSRYFSSELVSCERCLSTTTDGIERHHHDILQAAIVHPDKRVVLPLAPEFILNSDGRGGEYHKQDCEINAGHRMLERLRSDYPRMAAIIVADSLYSKQPFVEKLTAGRFSFLLVAKPGDHKSLFQDVDGLRRGNLLDRHHTVHRGKRHEYEWVTGVPLNGSPDAPLINFIQFRIIKDGEVKYRNAWVTDLVPTTDNIVQLVRAARARWKIENEGFNTLKNQGYHLKHNFGHGDRHLSEALFVVNLLAFFMHQIFELVDGMYQRVRTFFSSRRAFWDEARSAFRLFLFTSWDQVLERMNSPPEQLPPFSVSVVHGLHRCIYASGGPRARQLRTIACAVSPLCALPRRHWLTPTPRPRFWRSGDGLVLPYGPPATSWTPSCRQFASFHAAKAAHRELLAKVLRSRSSCLLGVYW